MTEDIVKHHLSALKQSHTAYEGHRRNLWLAVQIAREKGATWEQVGDTLGVTKQAAQQRFGKEYPSAESL